MTVFLWEVPSVRFLTKKKEVAQSNWVNWRPARKRTISEPKGVGRSPGIMQCWVLIPAWGLTRGARRWNHFQNVLICQGESQGINPASPTPYSLSHPCPCSAPHRRTQPPGQGGERESGEANRDHAKQTLFLAFDLNKLSVHSLLIFSIEHSTVQTLLIYSFGYLLIDKLPSSECKLQEHRDYVIFITVSLEPRTELPI